MMDGGDDELDPCRKRGYILVHLNVKINCITRKINISFTWKKCVKIFFICNMINN